MSKSKKPTTSEIIAETLLQIEEKFGKEAIMLLGARPNVDIDVIPTGSYAIDHALGIGGLPKGRIIEIYGPESSGKTTISLHAIAEVQKQGGIAAFVDAEHSIDPQYAKNLGINIDELILSQPDSGEQALEIVDTLVKTGVIDLVVIDSVAALVPEAELAGAMKEQSIGLQARLMSKALRKITGSLNRNHTTVIFINQVRQKIGIIFGSPQTTPGGKALKFYASIRLEVNKSTRIMDKNEVSGNLIVVRVVKNKLAPPYKVARTEIVFSKGINKNAEVLDKSLELKMIEKKGSWFSLEGQNVAQGRTNMVHYLDENPQVVEKLLESMSKSN